MKKIISTLAFVFALSINAFSQKLVKTYWDWSNKKLQAAYYTDAYGTKNGSFKGYSEYGGLLMQGTFKDGKPIGKWIENYENGKLHFVKVYNTPGNNNLDVVDGKITSYYENGVTLKYERNFRNAELDGDCKEYSENGTLIKEGKYVNGVFERTGDSKKIFDEEQKKYAEEQDKIKKQQEDETAKVNEGYYKYYIANAEKAYAEKDFNLARSMYTSASNYTNNEQYAKKKIEEIDTVLQKIAQAKVKVELQVVNIDTLYNIYKRNYVINKESIWLIDSATNKPLVRETYPKGEYLFKKTDSIIQPLLNEYSSIKDFETKLSKGYYIITFLDKMISLCNTDTKEINKQIKNAKTEDEIKKILGL